MLFPVEFNDMDIDQLIRAQIEKALISLGVDSPRVVLEHPGDLAHGDFSTNVALAYAKELSMNPREVAEKIVAALHASGENNLVREITIAGPGFINFYLSDEFFTQTTQKIAHLKDVWGANETLAGKKVMVEYTQPNPFKPFHIGHLMSNAIGESVSRLVEFSGATIVRANYQGDVGPHVAKAIWYLQKIKNETGSLLPKSLEGDSPKHIIFQAQYIGDCYVNGSDAYENNPESKLEIDEINKKIYEKTDPEVNQIYDWGREVTLEAFEKIYHTLGTKFDHYFFESEMAPIGQAIVMDNIPKVFEVSDGAIVFHAEKFDPKLHTRVFVNSKGLPTYETKEIGLTVTKFEKENPDISIVTTAIEQAEYMKVVEKALSIIRPELQSRMKHITHGMMRLASGKMSSRKGNVVTGESLITDSRDVVFEKIADRGFDETTREQIATAVGVAALKYSILKSSLGSDIIYDFEKSISFEGDSGPYLQYSAIRAQAILKKAEPMDLAPEAGSRASLPITTLERMLYRFPLVVSRAREDYEPHHVATYLTELASAFNQFYNDGVILDATNPTAPYKLALVQAFFSTMKNGLWVLGITVPERM